MTRYLCKDPGINRTVHHVSKSITDSLWVAAQQFSADSNTCGITIRQAFEATDASNNQAKCWFDAWTMTGYMVKSYFTTKGVRTCKYFIPVEYQTAPRPAVNYMGEFIEDLSSSDSQFMWDFIMASDTAFSVDDIINHALQQKRSINRKYARNYLHLLSNANYLVGYSQGFADKENMRNNTTVLPYLYDKTSKVTKAHVLAPVIKKGRRIIDPNAY